MEHHSEIPADTLDAIWNLCSKLEKLLEARKIGDEEEYRMALDDIPAMWRDKWPELLRMCVQFLVTLLDVRRGNEGLELLTKGHFQLKEEGGYVFFEKVITLWKLLRNFRDSRMRSFFEAMIL